MHRLTEVEDDSSLLVSEREAVIDTKDSIRGVQSKKKARLLRRGATRLGFLARVPAIICELAPDGTTLFVNDAVTRITGYRPDELIGNNWREVFYPGEQRRQVDVLYHSLQLGDVSDFEMTMTAKDGSLKTVMWNSFNTYSSSKDLEIITGFGVDITERKRAENALRESEGRYRELADSLPEPVFEADEKGRILFGNRAAFDHFGYTQEDFEAGLYIAKMVAPGDLRRAAENIQRVLCGDKIGGQEYAILKKDGTMLHTIVHSSPIIRGDKTVGLRGVIVDITERKAAEENLTQSLEKLQKMMRSTIEALALASETRDLYTAGHQRQVAKLAEAIAREMALANERIDGIYLAAAVHDIGKICVPAEILSKPGQMSEIEFGLIAAHSQVGYNILKTIDFPWPIAQIVLQHHERIDGSGYPSRLTGQSILLEARILGVADVVEAMASHRPYRAALGVEQALEEISQNSGILYDPEVVDACLRVFNDKGFVFG